MSQLTRCQQSMASKKNSLKRVPAKLGIRTSFCALPFHVRLTLLSHTQPLEEYYKGTGNTCLILIFHHENPKWLKKKRIYWISEVIYRHLKKKYRKFFQNYRVSNTLCPGVNIPQALSNSLVTSHQPSYLRKVNNNPTSFVSAAAHF